MFAKIILNMTVSYVVMAGVLEEPNKRLENQSSPTQDLQDKAKPAQWLEDFKRHWDEERWEKPFRGGKYMRATGDPGWKYRMTTMQKLVQHGEASIPALERALADPHVPTRILAAQTLGYLAKYADVQKLETAVTSDSENAVRLYAVDALGMSGKGTDIDWDALAKVQKNRDVLKHINYAKERGAQGVREQTLKRLCQWDPETIDTAIEGKQAPDFRLDTVDGKEIQLSQFRGKNAVVLVFVYGDT